MTTLNIHKEFVLNGATVSLLLLAQRGVQAITGNPPAPSRALLADALKPLLDGEIEETAPVSDKPVFTESALFQAELRVERLQSAFDSLVEVAKAGDPQLKGVTIDPETGDLVCDYTQERVAEMADGYTGVMAAEKTAEPIVINGTTSDEVLETVGLERVEKEADDEDEQSYGAEDHEDDKADGTV